MLLGILINFFPIDSFRLEVVQWARFEMGKKGYQKGILYEILINMSFFSTLVPFKCTILFISIISGGEFDERSNVRINS